MLKKLKKRLLACAAAVVFALGGGAPALREAGIRIDLPVFSADIVDSGYCGDPSVNDGKNVSWTLDSEGTVTISGIGVMENYKWESYSYNPWYDNINLVKKVEIKEGVMSIGSNAFRECKSIESITIPDSVTSIGGCAFYCCINLMSIIIPDSVTSINSSAFDCCTSLKNITIPDGVTSISHSVFNYCTNLTSIYIPDSVTSIGSYAFEGCKKLARVTIPNNVISIGYRAFYDCESLTNINIPKNINHIEESVFSGCRSLTSIIIPDSVTSIDSSAFDGCTSLKNITIPNSVTRIGYRVFRDCTSLEIIKLPNSVTSIGNYTFDGCTSLASINIEVGNTKYKSIDGVLYNKELTQVIKCPQKVTKITIPDSVTSICEYAFDSCTDLTRINIPNNVTDIGYRAFRNCKSLTNLAIPNSVKIIGGESFYGCINIISVTIPNSITIIGDYAFGYYDRDNYYLYRIKGFKIYCYKDSVGEKYAKDKGFEYDLIDAPAADTYIINEVSKYCTDLNDDFYKRVCAVFASGADWSVMQNELLKILSGKGINDIHEGMDYLKNYNKELSDALPYRMNYQYLTSNEVYCASQFDRWLMSDEATAQRLLLYASGLIFNNEFFGSINLSTDLIEHYPEAKKNKEMLRDFLESTDKGFDVYSDAETTGKYINSALKVLGTDEVQRANIADLQKQMFSCKDDVEWKKLQKSYTAALAGDNIDKNGKVLVNVKSISKALGKSTSALSFASATTDDIIKMINLENEVALYQENIKFLKTIVNSESATYAMRVAANSLLEDINLQYYRLTENILRRTFNFAKEMVDFDEWKEMFGDVTGDTIGKVLGTYKLAVFFSNMVIDTGDFVKQTSYTQGYAQLSAIYADILKKDKERFNSNKTADNAWQFFEDYTILWQLRYKGEEQYEKAQHVKSFFKLIDNVNLSYFYKLPVIEANLLRLNDAKFTVSSDIVIPTSVKYMKKAVIHCPVDVYVYNSAGQLIATLRDGAESDITNSYGRFAVVYNPVIDEYEKVICQTTNEELKLKISAVDSGLVDYDFAYLDSNNKIKIQSFDNEALNKGDAINISASKDTNKYEIDLNDDGTIDSSKTLSQNNGEYIKVDSISVDKSDYSLSVGDTEVIAVNIKPANATYNLLNWSSGDNSIVEVDNGKMTAKSVGNTEIYVQSADNPSVCLTIKVIVNDKTNIEPGDLNASGGKPDVEDLVLMQKLVAGWKVDDQIKTNADLDGSGGKPDVEDLVLLQKIVAGWKVDLDKIRLSR